MDSVTLKDDLRERILYRHSSDSDRSLMLRALEYIIELEGKVFIGTMTGD